MRTSDASFRPDRAMPPAPTPGLSKHGIQRMPTTPSQLPRVAFSVCLHAYRTALTAERRTPCGTHSLHYAFEEHTMARIGAFCITTWLAAAILYFGQHSVAMIALSGVVVFGGFDLLRP